MAKEISFRAKRLDNNRWVKGFYVEYSPSNCKIIEVNQDDESSSYISYPVDKKTLGQDINLMDSKGKEIYEGDIVGLSTYDAATDTYDFWRAVVEFGNPNSEYNWGFQLKPITKTDYNKDILLWVDMEDTGAYCEIIGNIHDNPELLKG